MIYLLKFGGSLVLPPGIFFVIFFGLAIYLWRQKQVKAAGILAMVNLIFYLLSTSWLSGMLLAQVERQVPQMASPQGDVIVMLGGGATKDTPNMGELGNLTNSPASRLLATYELYQRLQVPILVSGGQVYADSGAEAQLAARELLRLGVKPEDIIIEDRSLNTRQNAVYSCELLRQRGLEHPVLVTSAFHMNRGVLNFAKEGMAVDPYPTDYRVNQEQVFHYNKLMPSAGALEDSVVVMQEVLRTTVTRYLE